MGSITIREIDDALKARLRVRAERHGRSMESEARDILRSVLWAQAQSGRSLVESIRARFEPLGGVDVEMPAREPMLDPEFPHGNRPR